MTLDQEITEIRKTLEEHEKRISRLERSLKAKREAIKKKISLKEFIISKGPKGGVQKALAIGYYLEKYGGLLHFNAKDIEKGFRTAKEKAPKNVSDTIYANAKKGHMMEVEERKGNLKAWTLTDSGEKYVEGNFKKE